ELSGALKGKPRSFTYGFDGSPVSFGWSARNMLCFTAERQGTSAVVVALGKRGAANRIETAHSDGSLTLSGGGLRFALAGAGVHHPPEVFVTTLSGGADAPVNLSQANSRLLDELALPRPESVTVPGEGSTPMQMWILKPPGFDPNKKWPLAFLVHGGPQGAWLD